MTPLVDTIEQAFREGRESWTIDTSVNPAPLLEALAVRGITDDGRTGVVEGALVRAFLDARAKWGVAWTAQSGDVAELICDALADRDLL